MVSPIESPCLILGISHAQLPPVPEQGIEWRPGVYDRSIGDHPDDPNHVIRYCPTMRSFRDSGLLRAVMERGDSELARLAQCGANIPTYDHGPIQFCDDAETRPCYRLHSRVDHIEGVQPSAHSREHAEALADFSAAYLAYLMTAPEDGKILYDVPSPPQLCFGQPGPSNAYRFSLPDARVWVVDIGPALTDVDYARESGFRRALNDCLGMLATIGKRSEKAAIQLQLGQEFRHNIT
jgi:hypothetical protein